MLNKAENDVFINGSNDGATVANAFAPHFESVYYDCSRMPGVEKEFRNLFLSAQQKLHGIHGINSTVAEPSSITVELVDRCIRKLNLRKDSGRDDLSAKHLIYAYPLLTVHLCAQFSGIAVHGFVLTDFGYGIIIPLLKDRLGNTNDVGNYL